MRLVTKSYIEFPGSSFLALGFPRDVTCFHGIALAVATSFIFSRILKTNLEPSAGYLQRYFLDHARFFSGKDH